MKKHVKPIIVFAGASILLSAFINLNNPDNYAGQITPAYITKDNSPPTNAITNKGATLGRVLFYDRQLSANNSISCASCHLQKFAFGDTATLSKGHLGGLTDRHSMRLANARFSAEQKFFWNERATSLEDQTSLPVKDLVEMGWSGTNGQGNIDSLIKKMKSISYYKVLFPYVFGDSAITETRIQSVLAQFVRSIQSFDSKFDQGLAQTNNLAANFPNFTAQENQGKALFLAPPPAGGAGCQGCHAAPEFDIDPNTLNNGVIGVAGSPGAIDLFNTRAPSLRNLFNAAGQLNGALMHNGQFKTIEDVINHYNNVPQTAANTNLDPRLSGPGGVLNLSQAQKTALAAFLKTLSGTAVYTDSKWSDPFDAQNTLELATGISTAILDAPDFKVYPNPSADHVVIRVNPGSYSAIIYDAQGKQVLNAELSNSLNVSLKELPAGVYYVELTNLTTGAQAVKKIIHY
jgi:cytochrome c peroxidase